MGDLVLGLTIACIFLVLMGILIYSMYKESKKLENMTDRERKKYLKGC